MQKLRSTCEGENGRLLTGERLGVELLTSASIKELECPVATGLAWPRFFRRMTRGIVLSLTGGKGLGRSSEPSLNLRLFALVLGSPAGLFTLPSLCWSWRALPASCWLGEKSASSKNSKLLRSPHDEASWNNVGGTELWDSVCMVCAITCNTALRKMLNAKKTPGPLARLPVKQPGDWNSYSGTGHGVSPILPRGWPSWELQEAPSTLSFACSSKQKEKLLAGTSWQCSSSVWWGCNKCFLINWETKKMNCQLFWCWIQVCFTGDGLCQWTSWDQQSIINVCGESHVRQWTYYHFKYIGRLL